MKPSRQKNVIDYDINNDEDLALLQKRAKFKYVDKYTGKESKRFKRIFKHPTFLKLLNKYTQQPLVVAQIAILGSRGLGVLATEDLFLGKTSKPRKLGIYWGELIHEGSEHSHYVFVVSKYEIDAQKYGNWTRFVNHSKANFNVVAYQKVCTIGKVRLPYIEYALIKDVKAGEQLLVDYGPEYDFDKKHQIFLNPSNNSMRAANVYALYSDHYIPIKGKLLKVCRELIPHDTKLYGPDQYINLLNKPHKSSNKKSRQPISSEIPVLSADKQGHILADKYQEGITALMLAAYMGNIFAIRSLLKNYHANIEQQNIRTGYTALFYAIQSKSKPIIKQRIVKLFIELGTNLLTQDKDGLTVLHWCVKQKDLRLLKIFFSDRKIKSEAMEALDVLDRDELCPIIYAISRGEVEIAEYLLDIFERYYKKKFFNSLMVKRLSKALKGTIQKYLISQSK